MVEELGRRGKAAAAGFYDYPEGGRKRLWPGLREHFGGHDSEIPLIDIQERYLLQMALETAQCFADRVIASSAAAKVGSVMGIGFPPLHGGAVQYMQRYAGGLARLCGPGSCARDDVWSAVRASCLPPRARGERPTLPRVSGT